jgi:hypothetical protein
MSGWTEVLGGSCFTQSSTSQLVVGGFLNALPILLYCCMPGERMAMVPKRGTHFGNQFSLRSMVRPVVAAVDTVCCVDGSMP